MSEKSEDIEVEIKGFGFTETTVSAPSRGKTLYFRGASVPVMPNQAGVGITSPFAYHNSDQSDISEKLEQGLQNISDELQIMSKKLDSVNAPQSEIKFRSDEEAMIRDSLLDLAEKDGELDISNIQWVSPEDVLTVALDGISRTNIIATEALLESRKLGREIDLAAAQIDESLKAIDSRLSDLVNG